MKIALERLHALAVTRQHLEEAIKYAKGYEVSHSAQLYRQELELALSVIELQIDTCETMLQEQAKRG